MDKYEQVSAVVCPYGWIVGKTYTRHGDAIRYLNELNKYRESGYKVQRFNLVPDETYEYQKGK